MSIESMMASKYLILCRPLLLLPSIFPSIRVFSNKSALHIRWPKYWSFSLNISPSNEHPGLVSFRMDWLDFLVVQGTLKSLLQHHSSKASILRRSAFFLVQLSHPYVTTGKTIALTRQTFVVYGHLTNKENQGIARLNNLPTAKQLVTKSQCQDTCSFQSLSSHVTQLPVSCTAHCSHLLRLACGFQVGPCLISFMQVRKQRLELDMEQQTGSKQEKEYVKAVYCHPAYLTYMQSTS